MSKTNLLAPCISLAMLLFVLADFYSSSNSFYRGMNRNFAYISELALALIMILFLVLRVKVLLRRLPTIVIPMLLIPIWISVSEIVNGSLLWDSIIHIGLSSLWIITFLFFYLTSMLNIENASKYRKLLVLLFFTYLFITAFSYYNLQSIYGTKVAVNWIYNVLVLFIGLNTKESGKSRILFTALTFIAVVISNKTGAMLLFPLIMISSVSWKWKRIGQKWKIGIALLVALALLIVTTIAFLVITKQGINQSFIKGVMGGSGRIDIYRKSLYLITNQSFLCHLIGNGSTRTIVFLGTGAHNEFLEFYLKFGLIGLFLFLAIIYQIIKWGYSLKIRNSENFAISKQLIAYVLTLSLFSGFYFVHSTLFYMSLFGMVVGGNITHGGEGIFEKCRDNNISQN